MKSKIALLFLFFGLLSAPFTCRADVYTGVDGAQFAFSRGHADDALRVLGATLHANSSDAAAWNLQCRIYLAQSRWDDAIASCQRAVQVAPGNSLFHLWLGRAYGEKASRASMFSAYQTAKLVRSEFETAVSLDNQNREALSDLGEYYVDAPKFLGGGFTKAQSLVGHLNHLDPMRGQELLARIAEGQKDYVGAEGYWRARIDMAQGSQEKTAQAWMDLGSFYRRRGRFDEMTSALKSGAAADINHGPALVDGASTLIAADMQPQLAEQWLRQYLNGNALTYAAPAFAVHTQLADLLKKQGDTLSADREYAAARALSGGYVQTAAANTGY